MCPLRFDFALNILYLYSIFKPKNIVNTSKDIDMTSLIGICKHEK